jgi:hypothetical protein
MTAARQERKRSRGFLSVAAGFVLALVLPCLPGDAPPVHAATSERMVVDWHTGLAIGGYDPVAYFTDGTPRLGSADFELRFDGAIWRFCNSGDRDAFAARPDVYMPRFGGYDPVGVAHGVAVAGNPKFWRISGERLFLFYDQDRLQTFGADAQRVIAAADRKWPDVQHTLTP